MRAVNQKARKVLDILVTNLNENNPVKKINNAEGAFMAVCVEDISCLYGADYGRIFSVAHYYTQNGDAMRDPEMIFWKDANGDFYPAYFRQDGYFGTEQETIKFDEKGEPARFAQKRQTEQAMFAGKWMENIKYQQGLK